MCVDAAGRGQHRALRGNADGAQPVHAGAFGTRGREIAEERRQGVGAAAQQASVHVAMCAVVDMADKPGLRIGLDLERQAKRCEMAELFRIKRGSRQ